MKMSSITYNLLSYKYCHFHSPIGCLLSTFLTQLFLSRLRLSWSWMGKTRRITLELRPLGTDENKRLLMRLPQLMRSIYRLTNGLALPKPDPIYGVALFGPQRFQEVEDDGLALLYKLEVRKQKVKASIGKSSSFSYRKPGW